MYLSQSVVYLRFHNRVKYEFIKGSHSDLFSLCSHAFFSSLYSSSAVFHDYGERYSCDYIQLAFELLLLSPPLPLRVVHLGAFNWLYEPATSFLYPESRPMPRSPN